VVGSHKHGKFLDSDPQSFIHTHNLYIMNIFCTMNHYLEIGKMSFWGEGGEIHLDPICQCLSLLFSVTEWWFTL
jgi:hypothetical protein